MHNDTEIIRLNTVLFGSWKNIKVFLENGLFILLMHHSSPLIRSSIIRDLRFCSKYKTNENAWKTCFLLIFAFWAIVCNLISAISFTNRKNKFPEESSAEKLFAEKNYSTIEISFSCFSSPSRLRLPHMLAMHMRYNTCHISMTKIGAWHYC